jgi:predicted ATPase/DNA-binding CsgD family transcriptional regulator
MDVPRSTPAVNVSERERDVLAAVGEHLTNAEVAERLVISVRTVESHVSSLLRKFGVRDRRALVAVAADLAGGAPRAEPRSRVGSLPTHLTPFVGRAAERAALAAALTAAPTAAPTTAPNAVPTAAPTDRRLVTAVGAGGIGKTRLAATVAADLAHRFAGGVWYVDLVPVTDEAMTAAAVAGVVGLGEQPGRSAEQSVAAWLADREALLVLDNCEHLADGVVVLIERLLTACPRLRVLATSRARLLVPHEHVFPVPGLAVHDDGGDAVELFLDRVTAAGLPAAELDRRRVAALCRGLDGVALAIELAAARLPVLGLGGLEAGLDDRLGLLAGGRRLDDRHRSLRSALDWSHALLDESEQTLLRRVSVFAGPFTTAAAATLVTGRGAVSTALAALADHSLLTPVAAPDGAAGYRVLETIRQYGFEHLAAAGELDEVRLRHLRWCMTEATALCGPLEAGREEARAAFDRLADELLAALEWAAAEPAHRAEAHTLAVRVAELFFARGRPREAQRRFEQSADLAADPREAAEDLARAAAAAAIRHFGGEAIRLHRSCAEALVRAGDGAAAARHFAQAAEMLLRCPGRVQDGTPSATSDELAAEASAHAAGDPAAVARLAVVEAFRRHPADPFDLEPTEHAIALAQQAADSLCESAALDLRCSVELARGDVRSAARSAARRIDLVRPHIRNPLACGLEVFDAYQMAAESALAAGDLTAARELAEQVRDLPFYREEGHLATARLMVVTALSGQWDEHVVHRERFLQGWERAGRPQAGNLSRAPYAAAAVCGLRGDEAGRQEWLAVVSAIATPGLPISAIHHGEFFDALVLLHRGEAREAMAVLATPPQDFQTWYAGMWRPWYTALWVEAAVLSGHASAAERITRARHDVAVAGNPIALAMVDRSAALAAGDRDGVLQAAEELLAAGCRYQWARSLVLAGGTEQTRGEAELAAMGAVWKTR